MAVRPVFAADFYGKLCKRINTEFTFVRGMAKTQKTKCSINLRQAFLRKKECLRGRCQVRRIFSIFYME